MVGREQSNTAENSIPSHPLSRSARRGEPRKPDACPHPASQPHAVATAFAFGLFLLEVLGRFVLLA